MKTLKVFVGGPRSLKALPKSVFAKLDDCIRKGRELLIGDCKGADELIQRYVRQRRYDLVRVYASEGKERCNLGNWNMRTINNYGLTRYFQYDNYINHLEIAEAMALDADCAVMVWDRRSHGTFLNILNMVTLGKPVHAILQDGSAEYDIASFEDIHKLLPARWPLHIQADQPLTRTVIDENGTVHDYKTTLQEFVPSRDLRAYLEKNPLSKRDLIDVVLGSPRPLEAKLAFFEAYSDADDIFHEVVDKMASKLESDPNSGRRRHVRESSFAWFNVLYASCSTHRSAIKKALKALRSSGLNELIYRKDFWDEQPVLYEEHQAGVAPFHTFEEALEDLRFEIEADEVEDPAESDNCWTVFEKWCRTSSGAWNKPYTFYAIGDEVVFFEKKRYNTEGSYWETADRTYSGNPTKQLDLRVPFEVGDIVTLDCRPFAPLAHAIVLEAEGDGSTSCCLPWVLSKSDCRPKDGHPLWGGSALKHGGGLHICIPGYSVLYHLEAFKGELSEDELILREVQEWLGSDPVKGKLLDEALKLDMTADEIRQFMAERPNGNAKTAIPIVPKGEHDE